MAVSAVEGCSGPGEPGAKALVLAPASCLSPDRNLELPAAVGHSFTPAAPVSPRMVMVPSLRAGAWAAAIVQVPEAPWRGDSPRGAGGRP